MQIGVWLTREQIELLDRLLEREARRAEDVRQIREALSRGLAEAQKIEPGAGS